MNKASKVKLSHQACILKTAAVTAGILLHGYWLVFYQGMTTNLSPCQGDVPCLAQFTAAKEQESVALTVETNRSILPYVDLPSNVTANEIVDQIHKKNGKVLMFSPYAFSPGGREKNFFQVAAFFQQNDYALTMSSLPGNYCNTKQCIVDASKALDVELSFDFVFLLLDNDSGRTLREQNYDIYYEMGNSKFIQYGGPPGAFTIYQCQFPLDMDDEGSQLNIQDMKTVDIVIVNSEDSKLHYLNQTQPLFGKFLAEGIAFPNVEILYPPASLLEMKPDKFLFNFKRLLVRGKMTKSFFQQAESIPHLHSLDPVVASKNGQHSAYIYVHTPSIHVMYAVRNIMSTLGEDWNLYVGVQPKMRKYLEPLFANVQNARFLEHHQLGGLVTDYSNMLMSTEFWDLFDTEYILVFQPDCIMFYNDIDHFVSLGAPLLGALWCPNNEILAQHIVDWKVGNGGFSLRRKSWMQRCIASTQAWDAYNSLKKTHGTASGPLASGNEDVFFNVCLKLLLTRDDLRKYEAEATHFAIEVPCGRSDDYMTQGIMAGHAFWYYTDYAEHQKLLNGRQPNRTLAS